MEVSSQMPLDNPQQVVQWLQSMMPGYKAYTVRGSYVTVGAGSATGVLIRSAGPGRAKLIWAFPSMAVQLILTLAIVFSGILPGLLAFGIVWLVVSGDVNRMRNDIAQALMGQAPVAGAQAVALAPSSGGGGLLVGGIFMLLFAIGSFGFAASGFSDADRADRWASERSSSSYGSYGCGARRSRPGTRAARTHRAAGRPWAVGGGVMLLMVSVAMFIARSAQPHAHRRPPSPPSSPSPRDGLPVQQAAGMAAGTPGPIASTPRGARSPSVSHETFDWTSPRSRTGYPSQASHRVAASRTPTIFARCSCSVRANRTRISAAARQLRAHSQGYPLPRAQQTTAWRIVPFAGRSRGTQVLAIAARLAAGRASPEDSQRGGQGNGPGWPRQLHYVPDW